MGLERRRQTQRQRLGDLAGASNRRNRDPHPHNDAHDLRRNGGGLGLETMCIGGGQGLAAVFEAA
jgi:Thiolase, C-terminal domain